MPSFNLVVYEYLFAPGSDEIGFFVRVGAFSCCRLLLFFLVFLLSQPASAGQLISTIKFQGNDTTREEVMRLEMVVSEGDPFDESKIIESVQNVMDLGLFERVDYVLEQDDDTGDVELIITVIERYYILPLPTAKLNSDNELEYGIKLRWDNVWGLNHKFNWKVVNKGTKKNIKQYSNKIDYTFPRIFSSRYQLAIQDERQRIVDEDPDSGAQLQRSERYGFDVLKWLNGSGASRGLFASGGIGYLTQEISSLDQPAASSEKFNAVVYGARFGVENRHEYVFNRGGHYIQYKFDLTSDDQASYNTAYQRHELEYISLNSFSHDPPVNFNYRVVLGQSNNDVFGDKAFQLGGNTNLRGYKTGTYRGNAVLRGNFEYLSQLFDSALLRKVVFFDTGSVPEKLSALNISEFKSSAGLGIRWKLRQFVNLDIRVDAAFAFATGEVRYSLGTHSTF